MKISAFATHANAIVVYAATRDATGCSLNVISPAVRGRAAHSGES
jgi:hypothetical protein